GRLLDSDAGQRAGGMCCPPARKTPAAAEIGLALGERRRPPPRTTVASWQAAVGAAGLAAPAGLASDVDGDDVTPRRRDLRSHQGLPDHAASRSGCPRFPARTSAGGFP